MSESTTPTAHHSYPCGGCGARVEYAPGTTALHCPYCGFQQQIAAADRDVREHSFAAFQAPPQQAVATTHKLVCTKCGAHTESDAISSRCQFCGAPLVADTSVVQQVAPEAVLPFALDRPAARGALRTWVSSRWFAPNKLKRVTEAESSKSTYLPHWTFDADTRSQYDGQRGEHYYVRDSEGRRSRRTRWYGASGTVRRSFDDTLVVATGHVDREDLTTLEPWPLKDAVPYQPGYLAGHHALRYDVPPDAGLRQAKAMWAPTIEKDCKRDIGGDEQRVHSVRTDYANVTYKLMLLPVWICVYLYGGRPYQVLVNGRTGEVAGERPYSKVKIFFAVLAAVLAAAGAATWYYLSRNG
ncbi:MAG: hypothetical protein ACRDT6_17885 [Micromonosporaceae bacterium]